jgi:hypothetical protein
MPTQPSEAITIAGAVNPQQINNTSASAIIDMSKFAEALFVVQVGDIPTSGTVDAKLQESDSATFASGNSDISGKSATQLVAADDNKQILFNLKGEEMTKRYARVLITGSAHANFVAGLALGFSPRFGPASDDKASSVAQTIT